MIEIICSRGEMINFSTFLSLECLPFHNKYVGNEGKYVRDKKNETVKICFMLVEHLYVRRTYQIILGTHSSAESR
jgi:hypothetical protein